jgi:hypothetical protein
VRDGIFGIESNKRTQTQTVLITNGTNIGWLFRGVIFTVALGWICLGGG